MENIGYPIFLAVVAIGIYLIYRRAKKVERIINEKTESNLQNINNKLLEIGFETTNEIKVFSTAIRIDIPKKLIAICFPAYLEVKVIKFSDLIRCETIQDNSTIFSGGIGRAVIGGILAGGAGAVVGATTRSSQNVVSDMRINIITNNIAEPLLTIKLIDSQVERNSPIFKQVIEFAEKVQATMESIINQNQPR